MISDPSSIFYGCVSKGTTILAEFTTGDPDLDAVALKCLENAPRFHSVFSHTARRRSYTFLMDGQFVYLAISGGNLEKAQRLWFLHRLKDAFEEILEVSSAKSPPTGLTAYCFQSELNPVFRSLLNPPSRPSSSRPSVSSDSRNVSMDSSKEKKMGSVPLLGKPCSGLKKKKRSAGGNDGDAKDALGESKVLGVTVDGEGGITSRDLSESLHDGGLVASEGGRQKAKREWRRHAVVALMVDVAVCCVLFGVWLGVCKGFQCMND